LKLSCGDTLALSDEVVEDVIGKSGKAKATSFDSEFRVMKTMIGQMVCTVTLINSGQAKLTGTFVNLHIHQWNTLKFEPIRYAVRNGKESFPHDQDWKTLQNSEETIHVVYDKIIFPEDGHVSGDPDSQFWFTVPEQLDSMIVEWEFGGNEQGMRGGVVGYKIVRLFQPKAKEE
jgi:hypothetical protein